MATIEHKGAAGIGDVVVYNSGGLYYGHKLLKSIYIDMIGEYRYVTQPVKIRDNEIIKYTNGSLELISEKDVKDDYPLKWSKDPEYKKGDILFGKDGDKDMIFVYISATHVERLTPRSDIWSSSKQGYSTLSDFQRNFGPLKLAQTAHPTTGRFSDL